MDFQIWKDMADARAKLTIQFQVTIDGKSYEVTARAYIPIEEKLELVQKIVDLSFDANYPNDAKILVATIGQFMRKYTDIDFGDATDSDIFNAVTILDEDDTSHFSTSAFVETENALRDEFEVISDIVQKIKDAYYKYNTSALGVLDAMQNFNADAEKLSQEMKDITNPDSLKMLKQITDKLN